MATSNFASLARSMARTHGVPGLSVVAVPHPLGGIPEEDVRNIARSAIEEIIEKATRSTAQADEARKEKEDLIRFTGSASDVTLSYYSKGWTDGLPIVPPTREAVQEMLRGTDLPPHHVLGVMPPRDGRVTVEKMAVNAVMAGCRPTYLPVLIAAVEGLLEKDFDLLGVQTSTGPHSPLLIVNGPVRHQIRLNCSSGALGPGWQANASIGRAIRLMQNNIGGAAIGTTDMTTLGMGENYTYCLGENEEMNPWGPFHVEQGFDKEDSTVSVIGAYSPEQVSDHVGIAPEEILAVAADVIARITRFHLPMMDHIILRDSVLVLSPEHAGSIAAAGWSRKDVQKFLFERCRIPYEKLTALKRAVDRSALVESPEGPMVPLFSDRKSVV